MKLKIENWIIDQKLSKKVTPLFDEAIKSYKASAYKAALLFSYLGFMTILKERIINAQLPPGIPQGMWDQLKRDIQNRESWDKKIFETTQIQNPAIIFPITDTIRREIVYWKDRRNDCAHFKHEQIDYHHVESFWSFLETNLSKLTINGGKDALIRKFKNHFDPSLTAPDEEILPLIVEIENAVEAAELTAFFESLEQELDHPWEPEHFNVFNAILSHYDNNISEELVNYLKSSNEKLLSFIRSFPDKILYLDLSNEFARNLWYEKLFTNSFNDFNVYSSLLQNNMIRQEDIDNANERVVNRLNTQIPADLEKIILIQNRFYNSLKQRLFPDGGIFSFETCNKLSNLMIHYISSFPIDLDIVSSINGSFTNPLQPNVLQARFRTYFTNTPAKKDEFNAVLAGNPEIHLSERLDFITN
jgi:hypothetical protein